MGAGRPKKYLSRYDTQVSVEKDLWDIAKNLGITLSEAVSYGLQVLIEAEIRYRPDLTSDDLDRYLKVKKQEMDLNRKELSRKESVEETVQTLIDEKRSQEELKNRKIKVWNIADSRYEDIPESQFNEIIHKKVVRK